MSHWEKKNTGQGVKSSWLWWGGKLRHSLAMLVFYFFFSSFYYMSYWCHLADWKRVSEWEREKRPVPSFNSVSSGKQHTGNFPIFGFPTSLCKFKHTLGQFLWLAGILSFFKEALRTRSTCTDNETLPSPYLPWTEMLRDLGFGLFFIYLFFFNTERVH